jgi:hypothetical protein
MLSRFRSQMSPAALAISMIALFVAISGVAGALPGKNTVNSGDIKNNKVTGKDVNEKTLKIPTAALPPGSGASIAISATGAGALTKSTLPGVTLQKTADLFVYTFPRNVANCVPVLWPTDATSVYRLVPSAAPNEIRLDQGSGGGDHNLVVTCPD